MVIKHGYLKFLYYIKKCKFYFLDKASKAISWKPGNTPRIASHRRMHFRYFQHNF